MKHALLFLGALAAVLLLNGCERYIPVVSLGINDTYRIERMKKLPFHPALTGETYRWTVDGVEVSDKRDYIFVAEKPGEYLITLDIIDPDTPFHHSISVTVLPEEIEYSPYISKVLEYRPAPGQFINEMPKYEEGDTETDMIRKAQDCISGKNDVLISLGGYGGYVTFAFDHTVMNVPGEYDFRIWGNCFYELTDTERKGGSAEPGIVMVSFDANCNGVADDEWYQLKGSEYSNPLTLHNYSITYTRPHTPSDDIPWTDSEGERGYVFRNSFHAQDYFPKWILEDELKFSGSRLPANGTDISGDGTYYILYCFARGYADNHPNEFAALNSFDISNAVNAFGLPVNLPGVDFIRVYTGVNQTCGWLGETSTEICRAQDLHIEVCEY